MGLSYVSYRAPVVMWCSLLYGSHLHGLVDTAAEGTCPVGMPGVLGHVGRQVEGLAAQLLVDQVELLIEEAVHVHCLTVNGALDGLTGAKGERERGREKRK